MLRTTAALSLALALVTAAPAAAKGGGGGGGATAPAPVVASYCPADSWVVDYPDGSTSFANEASGAGCVWVRSYPAGYLRLDSVTLAPGWTYVVESNGEGTNSRVQLQFTETATGRKVDFRVEYGKTRIG
jgi:hypothetical protein